MLFNRNAPQNDSYGWADRVAGYLQKHFSEAHRAIFLDSSGITRLSFRGTTDQELANYMHGRLQRLRELLVARPRR